VVAVAAVEGAAGTEAATADAALPTADAEEVVVDTVLPGAAPTGAATVPGHPDTVPTE
jgi:hypothetical protein